MSHVAQFEENLKVNLQKRVSEKHKNLEVSGFWEVLLAALIPVLVELLNGCLARTPSDKVSDGLVRLGPVQRWRLKKAIRTEHDIPREDEGVCYNATLDTLHPMTYEDVDALVKEFNDEPGIGLW